MTLAVENHESLADEIDFNQNIYGYYINLDERGEFYADVRDSSDQTVFEINGVELFEDGFMRHKDDLNGLRDYMVSMGFAPKGSELFTAADFEEKVDELHDLMFEAKGPRLG